MSSPNIENAVVARAKRRYPDHKVDAVFPVCLPVYELRIRVTELAEHHLSTSARFILRLSDLSVRQPAEIGRLLGLSDDYVRSAAVELLSDDLVVQRNDLGIVVTDRGKEVLKAGGRSLRPRNRHPKVPYDFLTGKIIHINVDRLLDRDFVRKNGLFVVPAKPRRPSLSKLRIDEVKEYDFAYTHRRDKSEILEISDIKDVKLRYRNNVVLVKLVAPGSDKPMFAAYQAQQYLEEESAAIQRLADNGAKLVPEEFNLEKPTTLICSSLAHSAESTLVANIHELHSAVVEKKRAIAEAEAIQRVPETDRERTDLSVSISDLASEKQNAEDKLADREDELSKLTRGETRLLKTEEHRNLLLEAIDQASSELTLVSAWINPRAFDDKVRQKLAKAISRGVTVRIAWGLGAGHGSDKNRNYEQGKYALAKLKRMIPNNVKYRLVDRLTETHEKFIICDDSFCAWGSFNWLSYRGELDAGYRRETSYYSERPSDIALWKKNSAGLFEL